MNTKRSTVELQLWSSVHFQEESFKFCVLRLSFHDRKDISVNKRVPKADLTAKSDLLRLLQNASLSKAAMLTHALAIARQHHMGVEFLTKCCFQIRGVEMEKPGFRRNGS